jgi:hypothetical protein
MVLVLNLHSDRGLSSLRFERRSFLVYHQGDAHHIFCRALGLARNQNTHPPSLGTGSKFGM